MSSSSWRVIRPTRAGGGDEVAGTGIASPVADDHASVAKVDRDRPAQPGHNAVLRGRGRPAAAYGALGHGGLPAGLTGAVDAAELAEQLRRLEAEAEERGYEAGKARAVAELHTAVAGAGAVAARLQEIAPDRTSDIAHAVAELALSVAKRILQHEVATDANALCSALEAAVSTINGSPEAHVLLNPGAVDRVRDAWEALHGRAYLGKRWVFEGDPTLPPGGCTLRYEHGFVEAGLEAQLEEIGIALDRAIPALSRSSVDEDVA